MAIIFTVLPLLKLEIFMFALYLQSKNKVRPWLRRCKRIYYLNFTPALEQAKSSLSQIKTKRALTRVGVSLSQMTFSRPPLKRVYSSN
jgi:hypothetical protein